MRAAASMINGSLGDSLTINLPTLPLGDAEQRDWMPSNSAKVENGGGFDEKVAHKRSRYFLGL